MHVRSSLSPVQREQAVALFEQGFGHRAASNHLDLRLDPVKKLHARWRLYGRGALMRKPHTPSYSYEIKLEVARRHLAGEVAADLAAEFGLSSPTIVHNWSGILRREGEVGLRPKPRGRPPGQSVRPKTEVEKFQEEESAASGGERVPEKIAGFEGSVRTSLKAQAVAALKADYPLPFLLAAAGLARSTFFYHQGKPDTADAYAEVRESLKKLFLQAKGRYGHRRLDLLLTRQGFTLAKKTVLVLMRQEGLQCRTRRRRRFSSYKGQLGGVAANLLERKFTAAAPNTKWVTDVTEFRLGEQKLYLSPIMDLFDRQVISYSIGQSPTSAFTNASLKDALTTLGPGEKPIVDSDQGFHYQHRSWQILLAGKEAIQSMSRKGNCLDNAVIENFFGHLKTEMYYGTDYSSIEELTADIEDYINWYNTKRISIQHEGLSPAQYRDQTLAA